MTLGEYAVIAALALVLLVVFAIQHHDAEGRVQRAFEIEWRTGRYLAKKARVSYGTFYAVAARLEDAGRVEFRPYQRESGTGREYRIRKDAL